MPDCHARLAIIAMALDSHLYEKPSLRFRSKRGFFMSLAQ